MSNLVVKDNVVNTVFGRTGSVVSEVGDYTGSQVTNVPTNGIVSTNVQGAINELNTNDSKSININASQPNSNNLYDVAIITRTNSTSFDFFEDSHFIFNSNEFKIRIKPIGQARSVGVFGFVNSIFASGLPITAPASYDAKRVWNGGYANIPSDDYTYLSSETVLSDYDDYGVLTVICSSVNKIYRITTTGGEKLKFIVERFNASVLSDNVKITLDS